MEPRCGQSITQHAETRCLEKEQIDQDNDRHPRHHVSDDDSVPELAVRQQSVVRHQRAAVQTFGHHGRLPGIVPRSGRLANRCRLCFFFEAWRSSHQLVRFNRRLSSGCGGSLAFDERSRSRQRRDGHLLPYSDAAFVQFYVENRTDDFVPRFSIMHGSVESHAAR